METEPLLVERGKTHGDYTRDAECAMHLAKVVWDYTHRDGFSAVQLHAMTMICFKLARILAGDPDFADHWRDIAGYATLVADRCSK